MNQKLSHHFYRSSLIGLLSTSVLITMAVGGATAATHPKRLTTQSPAVARQGAHGQLTTKEVVRTISYVDPLTKQEHTIHQVARYQFDRKGQLVKRIDLIWPAYFAPVFAGYAPNSIEILPKLTSPDAGPASEKITYTKLPKQRAATTTRVMLTTVNGKVVDWQFPSALDADGHPLTSITLPTPPDGWEYVNAAQLPKTLPITPGTVNAYTFFIQKKVAHHETKPVSKPEIGPETKQLLRKIVLHLPAGDQIITQHATAVRSVTVKDGKTIDGKWQISPFDELELSPLAGYQASLDRVAALRLTPDQLDQELPVIEVQYHKLTSDEGTATVTTSDAATMTDPIPTTDAGSQTTISNKNEGSQTAVLTTSDSGTQTDAVTGVDANTQTAISNKDEGNQTDLIAGQEAGTQTTAPATSDGTTQTDPVVGHDAGSQTETTGKDVGVQTAAPATSDGGTQTDVTMGKDEGSQTMTPATTGEGTQTDLSRDTGTQTNSPAMSDGSTQTATITSTDANTQTTVSNHDAGTQTTNSGQDAGSQTDASTVNDATTQTVDSGKDAGTQTMTTVTSAGSTQTDPINGKDVATQTGQPTMTTTGSQTAEYSTVDTGVGDDVVTSVNHGSQTNNVTTVDTGVGDDRIDGVDQNTQTSQKMMVDTGTGDSYIDHADQVSQTAQAPTVDTDSGEGTDTPTKPSHMVNVAVGDDPVGTVDRATQTTDPMITTSGTGDETVAVLDHATQTGAPGERVSPGIPTAAGSMTSSGYHNQETQTGVRPAPDDNDDHHNRGVNQATQTDPTTASTVPGTNPTSVGSSTQPTASPLIDTGAGDDPIAEGLSSPSAGPSGMNDGPATVAGSDTPNRPTKHMNHDQPVSLAQMNGLRGAGQLPAGSSMITTPAPTASMPGDAPAAKIDPVAFHTELDQLQQPLRELASHPGRSTAATRLPQTGNDRVAGGLTLVGLLTSLIAATTALFKSKRRP